MDKFLNDPYLQGRNTTLTLFYFIFGMKINILFYYFAHLYYMQSQQAKLDAPKLHEKTIP